MIDSVMKFKKKTFLSHLKVYIAMLNMQFLLAC